MEVDKLILSLLARVRTWREERENYVWVFLVEMKPYYIKKKGKRTKNSIRRMKKHKCIRTLLSSITVLSDSIHIGSISPSRTIHLGPSWPTEVSSLMVEENRPNIKSEKYSKSTPAPDHHWYKNAHILLFLADLKKTHVMESQSNYSVSNS